MERFVKGDVVVVPFPFSDLTRSKRRPAFVISNLSGDDVILCQITSKHVKDSYSISLTSDDLKTGNLKQDSNVRPNRIFTADSKIILYKLGTLKKEKVSQIISKTIEIINN